jgi:hypothetical protein
MATKGSRGAASFRGGFRPSRGIRVRRARGGGRLPRSLPEAPRRALEEAAVLSVPRGTSFTSRDRSPGSASGYGLPAKGVRMGEGRGRIMLLGQAPEWRNCSTWNTAGGRRLLTSHPNFAADLSQRLDPCFPRRKDGRRIPVCGHPASGTSVAAPGGPICGKRRSSVDREY